MGVVDTRSTGIWSFPVQSVATWSTALQSQWGLWEEEGERVLVRERGKDLGKIQEHVCQRTCLLESVYYYTDSCLGLITW